jgi:uncharacterized protein with gpF-like domain
MRSDGGSSRIISWAKKLRDIGLSVRFQMAPAMQNVFDQALRENLELVTSIPGHYFERIRKWTKESVAKGGDLHALTKKLETLPAMTRRHAAVIARDQNRKMSSKFQLARCNELEIQKAMWVHSGGGKEPRPTHVRNNREIYNIVTGWKDPDPRVNREIHPGELINCRCVSRPIIDF